MTATNGDLNSFSTDELWRVDGNYSGTFWQELGYMVGYLNGGWWTGLFGAYSEPTTGYIEYGIVQNPPSNDPDPGEDEVGVSLAVETSNPSIVDANYNGATYARIPTQDSYSDVMQAGVESSSSQAAFNPFTGEVDVSNEQVLYAGQSGWSTWPGNGAGLQYYNDSPNGIVTCGWVSNYSDDSSSENAVACFYN